MFKKFILSNASLARVSMISPHNKVILNGMEHQKLIVTEHGLLSGEKDVNIVVLIQHLPYQWVLLIAILNCNSITNSVGGHKPKKIR